VAVQVVADVEAHHLGPPRPDEAEGDRRLDSRCAKRRKAGTSRSEKAAAAWPQSSGR
jgi:hypothetical protein